MKKITLAISLFVASFTFSQNTGEVVPCHQAEETEKMLQSMTTQERATYEQEQNDLASFTENYINNHPELLTSSHQRTISYTIPIVFHIIHAGGSENISNEQVEDCVRIMNDDFQKLNNDANNVNPAFASIVADSEIEFVLARKDPNGDCTNGITRTYSQVTFGGSGNDRVSTVANEHGNWPGDEDLNVFVAADIGGAAGYTFLPSNWVGSGMGNGIHILHNYVGSIGTSSNFTSRTMTHEVGHWLNLPHTWGAGNTPGVSTNCDQDDGVADTPNTIGWQSCTINGESCGDLDNVENYLEYSYCSKMFTNGQKARMHAALNSPTAGRNNISSSGNLIKTGVGEPEILCKAEFDANINVVCPGQSVDFTDYSFHSPTGWNWTFPGGTPSTSTDANPTITYTTPGVYEVTLEATDGSSSDTQTKTGYITVLDAPSNLPLIEGFEDYTDLLNSPWVVKNPGNNAAFELVTNVAHTGENSVKLANFGQTAGNIDELISSPVDLSTITDDMTISFRFAYRKRASSNEDWLRIFVSNDCGINSWSLRRNIRGNQLSDQIATSAWEPQSMDDWTTVHMTNVTSQFWVDLFRVKFQFESDGGNNFFLDDINIYSGGPSELSVAEENEFSEFNVFPNPASNEVNVSFSLESAQNTKISLLNTLGQTVKDFDIQANSGNNLVLIGTEEFDAGVYIIKVQTQGKEQTKRLIIK